LAGSEKYNLTPSLKEELIKIKFESLEPLVFSLLIPSKLLKTKPASNTFKKDDKG